MRKAFNFYQSHWEQIKLLNDSQKLELFNTICKVQFLEVHIDDISFKDNITQLVWTGIKHSINTSLSGYLTKQKSLNKDIDTPLAKGHTKGSAEAPTEDPCQQEKEKEKEEYTYLLENEFQELWSGYTLKVLKAQNRKGGNKSKALLKYKELRSKYEKEKIFEMAREHARQKIGQKDLERLLTLDMMKQFIEDSVKPVVEKKELKLLGA